MIIVNIVLTIWFWFLADVEWEEDRRFWAHVYLFASALNGAAFMSVVF